MKAGCHLPMTEFVLIRAMRPSKNIKKHLQHTMFDRSMLQGGVRLHLTRVVARARARTKMFTAVAFATKRPNRELSSLEFAMFYDHFFFSLLSLYQFYQSVIKLYFTFRLF